MEKQHLAVNTAAQASHKQPYAAPTATFVPLKLEERLLGCAKTNENVCRTAIIGS